MGKQVQKQQSATETKSIPMKLNKTLALFGLTAFLMLFSLGHEESVFWQPSPDPASFSIYHLALLCFWGGAWNVVSYYKKLYTKRSETKTLSATEREETKPYQLEVPLLLDRSDSLDAMQGSLRTGTTVLLGFAAAALAWLPTNTALPPPSQSLLWAALVSLGLMAGIAILFSYTDLSLRIPNIRMRDGLLPSGLAQEEYVNGLVLLIQEKENTLAKMRKIVGLGLLLFLMISIVSFLIIPYGMLPVESEVQTIYAIEQTLWFSSLIVMAGFLFTFAAYVVGKPVLGILESDELRSYFEWMKDDQSGDVSRKSAAES